MSCRCQHRCNCRHYTFGSFCFDIFMICITGGLWVIWMIVRAMTR